MAEGLLCPKFAQGRELSPHLMHEESSGQNLGPSDSGWCGCTEWAVPAVPAWSDAGDKAGQWGDAPNCTSSFLSLHSKSPNGETHLLGLKGPTPSDAVGRGHARCVPRC